LAEFYGSHFEYGGQSSRKYGLIVAIVDADENRSIASEMSSKLIYNKKNTRHYIVSNDYSSPTSFDVNIITDDECTLPPERRREIERWLFNRANYRKFYLDMMDDKYDETGEIIDGELKRLYLNCRFLNPERLYYNGGIVGYKATLEADGPMWWQDAVVKDIAIPADINTNGMDFVITVDTDLDDYTYPTVTFETAAGGGGFIWRNETDDEMRYAYLVQLVGGIVVTIDSETNFISGSNYLKMRNRYFPRLLNGDNNIHVTGAITSLSVAFSNRRFL
jgi:hypothetical protein